MLVRRSQAEFAEKLPVTRQAVSRWENGETIPNADTLKLIAKTFDVSVGVLLSTGAIFPEYLDGGNG